MGMWVYRHDPVACPPIRVPTVENSRTTRTAVAALALVVGVGAGSALSRPLEVVTGEKELSGLEWSEATSGPVDETAVAPRDPLPLRLVDMGGVGIPADTAAWGESYSHATHAFDQLILEGEPWIDPEGAARIRADWRRYLARMAGMGSNAVIADAFLELVNFDRVGDGVDVYSADDPLRARHLAYRDFFAGLAADASELGVEVYLKTDMPAATPALRRYLAGIPGGDDTSTAAFWEVYAAAFEEAFRAMPNVAGVVVRVGEAGPLYNVEGLDYASYMGVREPEQLQRMLQTLLPVFEAHDRTLIFRSWSVGLGALGDLHNEPEVYDRVLGPIHSPALVVSTKFVQGDYFGFLPLNPTLLVGDHRRIVEYQARREYEGFGALPNYLGHAHATSLRQVLAANPNVVGTSIWAQEGGPLRAGPLSLYDVAGFWRWTDATVYATSRLSLDPGADPRALAEEWARITFGEDREVARAMGALLTTSREALEKGFYIRPYAEQRMSIVGVDTPPILWIFEWDVVGGWSSVLASLYRSLSDDIETPIAEGREAVALTLDMQTTLAGMAPHIGDHPDYPGMVASLAYQESLFTALADFRESFLRYYRWLDRGGDPAPWRDAAHRFLRSADRHLAVYADDLDFPAFDFAPSMAATRTALTSGWRTTAARGLAALFLVVFLLGVNWSQRRTGPYPGKRVARLVWLGASQPYLLAAPLARGSGALWVVSGIVLTGAVASVALLLASPAAVGLGVLGLALSYSLALARSWRVTRSGRTPWAESPAALGPLLLVAALVLSVTAVRGPDYFWFLFWSDGALRTGLFAVVIALGVWAIASSHWLGRALSGGRGWFAGGSVMMAAGLVLLVLTGILPDLEGALTALDEPLNLLPMRRAIVSAITHYAGVSNVTLDAPAVLGAAILILGLLVRGRDRGARGEPGPTGEEA